MLGVTCQKGRYMAIEARAEHDLSTRLEMPDEMTNKYMRILCPCSQVHSQPMLHVRPSWAILVHHGARETRSKLVRY